MRIFHGECLDFVNVLKDSIGSLKELSIVKPQYGRRPPGEVRLSWAKVMRLATNLRKVKFDCSGMRAHDFIAMTEHAPQLTHIHLIASYGITQVDIKNFVKRPNLRCLTIQAPVYVSHTTFDSMVKYRKDWYDSPIDIFVRDSYLHVAKHTREDKKNSKYIRLHAMPSK